MTSNTAAKVAHSSEMTKCPALSAYSRAALVKNVMTKAALLNIHCNLQKRCKARFYRRLALFVFEREPMLNIKPKLRLLTKVPGVR